MLITSVSVLFPAGVPQAVIPRSTEKIIAKICFFLVNNIVELSFALYIIMIIPRRLKLEKIKSGVDEIGLLVYNRMKLSVVKNWKNTQKTLECIMCVPQTI